ncbi:hypothetical protein VC83_00467 [Pseudogymnoascus destructans]|uniref:Glycosyl hydrolases family 2 sugar binding domain-containing protein n=1 Tax=Pseudogymnoascus destructans TaxID=655981 RepID=A0A177AN00_9PEZI|nr:uncharacterized protein VC83_00467 [Pseudogymnoascus destructans]OAF63418.1 hypothetical protein VC83_00467 [Pseudogymnoascus destructans]
MTSSSTARSMTTSDGLYYQRDVIVPKGWSEERYFVRAESATHEGQIYVNDRLVASHVGGYTPFEADMTDLVTAGQQFRLTIAVNNIVTFQISLLERWWLAS